MAKNELRESEVLVCTVIGFPLGANTTQVKVFETQDAIKNGADEIDMVINISMLKQKEHSYITNEIKQIKQACGNKILKVIIETALLNQEEIIEASKICISAGADFVKTSTGFAKSGATIENVSLMKQTVGDKIKIKAAGGVRSLEDLEKMVSAGANRIGTSQGVNIIKGKSASDLY